MDGEHPQPQNPYEAPRSNDRPARSLGWKIGRQLAGWGLLALGVAGLALPILPGWVFIAWGAITLAPDIPFFAKVLNWIADKMPQLQPTIARLTGKSARQPDSDRAAA
ncbi:MAG TPA: hypothetical protein VFW87_04870 [Pirellulales bacterium]|nr:hypothetical protein [Pirellulales bacterium]